MTEDSDTGAPTKLTTTKQRWAREGRFLTGRTARPDSERLPPGQHLVTDWPVLDLGMHPEVPTSRWRLDVFGAVERPVILDWTAFQALPQSRAVSDIHCVTTWSRYDNAWDGVLTRDLLQAVMPKPDARFVVLQSHDGYITNLALDDFAAHDALLAHSWNGGPLAQVHGGRFGWSCHICISGKAPSGCSASSSGPMTGRASGKSAATTTVATLGLNSATPTSSGGFAGVARMLLALPPAPCPMRTVPHACAASGTAAGGRTRCFQARDGRQVAALVPFGFFLAVGLAALSVLAAALRSAGLFAVFMVFAAAVLVSGAAAFAAALGAAAFFAAGFGAAGGAACFAGAFAVADLAAAAGLAADFAALGAAAFAALAGARTAMACARGRLIVLSSIRKPFLDKVASRASWGTAIRGSMPHESLTYQPE